MKNVPLMYFLANPPKWTSSKTTELGWCKFCKRTYKPAPNKTASNAYSLPSTLRELVMYSGVSVNKYSRYWPCPYWGCGTVSKSNKVSVDTAEPRELLRASDFEFLAIARECADLARN